MSDHPLAHSQPGSFRFPREARLLTRSDFDRVFAARESFGDRYFRIHLAPGPSPRLGQVISRRVSRRAVDRNRIRRVVRESFRLHQGAMPDLDLVVVARSLAADESTARLHESLARHWQRLARAPEDRRPRHERT